MKDCVEAVSLCMVCRAKMTHMIGATCCMQTMYCSNFLVGKDRCSWSVDAYMYMYGLGPIILYLDGSEILGLLSIARCSRYRYAYLILALMQPAC